MEVIFTNDGSYLLLTENKSNNKQLLTDTFYRCRINQINIRRHYYLNFYLHDIVVIKVFQDGSCFLVRKLV